jgi:hypothetical protein
MWAWRSEGHGRRWVIAVDARIQRCTFAVILPVRGILLVLRLPRSPTPRSSKRVRHELVSRRCGLALSKNVLPQLLLRLL